MVSQPRAVLREASARSPTFSNSLEKEVVVVILGRLLTREIGLNIYPRGGTKRKMSLIEMVEIQQTTSISS
jgi:hypothetical protein